MWFLLEPFCERPTLLHQLQVVIGRFTAVQPVLRRYREPFSPHPRHAGACLLSSKFCYHFLAAIKGEFVCHPLCCDKVPILSSFIRAIIRLHMCT